MTETVEQERDRMRRWRAANPERVKAYNHAYYLANKERFRELRKRWVKANPERLRPGRRHRSKRYRENYPERVYEQHRRYYLANQAALQEEAALRYAHRMMHERCLNPQARGYALHGGRGIRVFEDWREFRDFLIWVRENLGPRPEKHTIGRIDINGHFEPGNMAWLPRGSKS